jgi:tRNA(adenine34) deaminase
MTLTACQDEPEMDGVADHEFMGEALREAARSLGHGEFPVGSVVVLDGDIVGRAYWAGVTRLIDHAEIVALRDAEGRRRLNRQERSRASMYTTLEPCALCMAASMSFLLGRIVFALEAPVDGGTNLPEVWQPANGHPRARSVYTIPTVERGVRRDESISLIEQWVRSSPDNGWAEDYLPQPAQ